MTKINFLAALDEIMPDNKNITSIWKAIKFLANYTIRLFLCVAIIACFKYTFSSISIDDFKVLFQNVFATVFPMYFILRLILFLWTINYEDNCTICTPPYGYASSCNNKINYKIDTNESLLKILATHEAGHALVAYIQGFNFTSHITCESSYISANGEIPNAEKMWSIILVRYAGIIAEQMILGESHFGSYGSDTADLNVARTEIESYVFMTRDDLSKCPDDPRVKEEVFRLSKEGFAKTKQLLEDHKETVQMLAEEFAKKPDWTYEEIQKFMLSQNKYMLSFGHVDAVCDNSDVDKPEDAQ